MIRLTMSIGVAALALAAMPAVAQSAPNTAGGTAASGAHTTGGHSNPAVKDSDPQQTTVPADGANSFTQDQARERLAKAGYQVTTLTKDAQGVWTGKATRDGKSMTVGLDYKGNVSVR